MKKKRYRSDLTDNQWKLIEPILPGESPLGRPRTTELREVMNALRYMSRTGCQWEMLPSEFPARSTVFDYFKLWRDEGILDEIVVTLRESIRIKAGRNCEPSAAIIDSQSVKTTGSAGDVGYDSGKKIKGRKRHLAVDVLGLLLMVVVHSAGIQDRAGATLLGAKLRMRFRCLKIIFADGGYSGSNLANWFLTMMQVVLQIVKRPRKKFQIVKFRWIVERTFGWFNTHRRLSKDYETSPRSAEAWVKLAAIHGMLNRCATG